MTKTTFDISTAPGYAVLASMGKTILRPGGRAATEQLFEWADFKPGQTVLELATGLGKSAIELAKNYGVTVFCLEQNSDTVLAARANVRLAGLEHLVQIVQGNIFGLDAISHQFDYILAEAILTMQSPTAKAKLLRDVYSHLKPGGHFLSHELSVLHQEDELHRILNSTLHANATPLTVEHWIDTFTDAGLSIQHHQTGDMHLLKLPQVIHDEGWVNTLRLVWSLMTQPQIRQRIFSMRKIFQQHHQDLRYIIISTIKNS